MLSGRNEGDTSALYNTVGTKAYEIINIEAGGLIIIADGGP